MNIGLPLAIHNKSRDKRSVQIFKELGIGRDYRFILNLEKRTEHAVYQRIQDAGGFCLPDFVKKGENVWFALDNIDCLEDTPYGQNTLHGTIIVLNEKMKTPNSSMHH